MSNSTVSTREGEALRAAIDSRGLRYSWVAQRLGITPSHLSRLMSGERAMTGDMAERLAALFDEPSSTFLATTAPSPTGAVSDAGGRPSAHQRPVPGKHTNTKDTN